MDSLTQIALGAAVGQAVLGRRVGYRAPLWGALLGTLPDLDVLVPMNGPVADFTYHRSFSHSLFTLTLICPLVTWLILKIHPATRDERKGWLWLSWLVLITHPLLDAFTVYGTQLLWPLSEHPFGLGSIFIIDPLYTLPLLIGVIGALLLRRQPLRAQRFNGVGLALSSLYLGWTLLAQGMVGDVARQSLADNGTDESALLATPTPFNTILWRLVAMTDNGYQEGFYSLLDQQPKVHFKDYPSRGELLEPLQSHWPVERLRWFSKGFIRIQEQQGDVVISDLRMGVEPNYVFNFKVGTLSNPHPQPTPDVRLPAERNWNRLPGLLRRIWEEPAPTK